jgi:hypothetical protein
MNATASTISENFDAAGAPVWPERLARDLATAGLVVDLETVKTFDDAERAEAFAWLKGETMALPTVLWTYASGRHPGEGELAPETVADTLQRAGVEIPLTALAQCDLATLFEVNGWATWTIANEKVDKPAQLVRLIQECQAGRVNGTPVEVPTTPASEYQDSGEMETVGVEGQDQLAEAAQALQLAAAEAHATASTIEDAVVSLDPLPTRFANFSPAGKIVALVLEECRGLASKLKVRWDQDDQEKTIDRLREAADGIAANVVREVSARSFQSAFGAVTQTAVKGGVKLTVTIPREHKNAAKFAMAEGSTVVVVLAGPDEFRKEDERFEAERDQPELPGVETIPPARQRRRNPAKE